MENATALLLLVIAIAVLLLALHAMLCVVEAFEAAGKSARRKRDAAVAQLMPQPMHRAVRPRNRHMA